MLSKQFKLDLRGEKNFFSNCKKKHSSYFSFFYIKNKNKGLRVSVIVPKKTIKLATDRNQTKRKIYSTIEKLSDSVKKKNIDLAIIVNKKAVKNEDLDIKKAIESSLVEIAI